MIENDFEKAESATSMKKVRVSEMRTNRFRVAVLEVFSLAVASLFLFSSGASAIPMWSRRYSVSCSYCHAYPGLQLTAGGLDFFRRGHRMEKDTFDKDLSHSISAHLEWEYDVAQGQSTAFESPELHLHAGGALSPLFSLYGDVGFGSDGSNLETLSLQLTKELGSDTYFTARGGKISPTIIRNYGNGLMASASTPLILTDTALGNNPFNPARDSFGVDVGYRWKSLFVQAGVLNGEDVEGQAAVKNHKDIYATAEMALPDGLSGVGLYYYRGGYDLGDPDSGLLFDRYDRTGVFANFTRDRFRVAGAYLWGKDQIQTLSDQKIHGWYAQADVHPAEWLAPFVRYDDVKTETTDGTDRVRQGTVGCAIRLFDNEITGGRMVIEGFRKKETGVSTTGALLNFLWAL